MTPERSALRNRTTSVSLRTAVKGSSVTAAPPGGSTPKKHGDMEICPDTAVSVSLSSSCLLSQIPQVSTLQHRERVL